MTNKLRELISGQWTIETDVKWPNGDMDFNQWLETKATDKDKNYQYLLAHADDGVIWGYVKDGELKTSYEAFPQISPPLIPVTLQQLRLFGKHSELHLWRTAPGQFVGRVIRDKVDDIHGKCFDEYQILWGDRWRDCQNGFTLVVEGQRGLRHAFPQEVKNDPKYFGTRKNPKHSLRLKLRHYIIHDEETGQARVYLSRLVGVSVDC